MIPTPQDLDDHHDSTKGCPMNPQEWLVTMVCLVALAAIALILVHLGDSSR